MSSGKTVDQLNKGVGNINLGSSDNGAWEEVTRKQKNKAGNAAGRQWGQQTSAPKAWGRPDTAHRLGIRSGDTPGSAWNSTSTDLRRQGGGGMRSQPANPESKQSVIAPPLEHGWNWAAKTGSSQEEKVVDKHDSDDDEDVYSDDELSDGYDSDEGPQTHETRKQHRMLKGFFDILDQLSVQEINDPVRQWHCPACQGGPGAIDWYKGIQPLMTHARTKGSVRVKLHREFAILLDEELRKRGASVVPAGESFGHWEGLKQETKDHEIVWPPMVMVMNTVLEQDDNDKWQGMGNQELLDYFQGYAATKARHSYGPKGHRGLSILVFEGAMGYVEAERLHKHFLGQGTGRNAWESKNRQLFYPGGKRQLYGFLARKDDVDEFNRHCQGKTRVKYEMRSYHEMVVTQMKQMSEDNQQLTWFKNRVAKEQQNAKALEESLNIVSQKLRQTAEENRIVRQRTKMQHEENKEEMDFQEHFFKDQIEKIHKATHIKEDNFEKLQQEERKKVEGSSARKAEKVTKFKQFQDEAMEKFVSEREELICIHECKKMELKKRHWEEEVELETDFDLALTKLMDKYAPRPADTAAPAATVADF